MKRLLFSGWFHSMLIAFAALTANPLLAADEANDKEAKKGESFTIADGAYTLTAPAGWNRKQPRFNLIEHEFEIPAAEGDAIAGRCTISNASGSIEDNINRWIGQFSQADGSSTRDKTKITDLEAAGAAVKLITITGTYDDKVAPFSPQPGIKRENYQLLGAVISTKNGGNYYVKFYGPAKTVSASEAGFTDMIKGMAGK